jgi:hypothetical protein
MAHGGGFQHSGNYPMVFLHSAPPCAIDTEEFLQGGLGEGQVLKRAERDEEAEWKLQRRTEAQAAGSPPS